MFHSTTSLFSVHWFIFMKQKMFDMHIIPDSSIFESILESNIMPMSNSKANKNSGNLSVR